MFIHCGRDSSAPGATEKPQFSPLYLKAATGQGKTHLLHAIGHSFLQAHPRSRIFYCSAERFMVEFVQALKANQMLEFKARLRSFDLLLVDDIQFIIGKASAQEELLYTIDALLAEGKRLVFAADRAPQALDGVEPRLLSRLSMGLVADIQGGAKPNGNHDGRVQRYAEAADKTAAAVRQ